MTRSEFDAVRDFARRLEAVVTARKMCSVDGKEEWRAAISELLAAAQAGVDAEEASKERMVMP